MSEDCNFEQRFDDITKLQYLNNEPSVMHCHHYTSLFIKAALKMEKFGGVGFLKESMEDSYYLVLKKYFITENITKIDDKKRIAEEYFRLSGMGKLELVIDSEIGGDAKMIHSHVDEGWIEKYGISDRPLNFIGQGYLAAVFAVIFNKKIRAYNVVENKSIVCGDKVSEFKISLLREDI